MARVIVPGTVTLESTTVDASAYPEYDTDPATIYSIGERVVVSTSVPHHEYEALQEAQDKPPATYPDYWLDLGVTNQYRLLDDSVSTPSTKLEGFVAVVSVPTRVSHLSVFGASNCESVRIQQVVGGVEVLDVTYPMRTFSPAGSWSEYLFSPAEYRESLIVPIPGWYSGNTFTLTFAGSTGMTVGIGQLSIGQYQDIGLTIKPLTVGIKDYSLTNEDEWGVITFTKRAKSQTIEGDAVIEPARQDTVARLMSGLRAQACVWDCNDSGTDLDALRLFGFYREFYFDDDEYLKMHFRLQGLT